MAIEVKVPVLPESVPDATLSSWQVKPGDAVTEGDTLVELETDKVMLEVPAPESGVVKSIEKEEGATVNSNDVIATIEVGTVEESAPEPEKKAPAAKSTSAEADDRLSPAVRHLVAEHDLNPSDITGTGRDGRLTKDDVVKFIKSGGAKPVSEPSKGASATKAAPSNESLGIKGERPERRVPMTRLRQRIAERLVDAQHTAAMLTTFNEVNMQPVMDLRAKYKEKFEKSHGTKLGFMSFFVKAATEALKKYPAVNASIDGKDIIYHGYFDIGLAVSSERGLVVPVMRDADSLTFAEIEKGIVEFGQKARSGSLTLEELTGGTFSISNGGIFGSMMSTPILNPPQSAILGMHNIVERAVVENGEIVIRPMMYLALTYDHRIIDGREAVQFLVTIKQALEDPARLLLQI